MWPFGISALALVASVLWSATVAEPSQVPTEIVVCSDKPAWYVERLQKFADESVPSTSISVEDGSNVAAEAQPDALLVYMGGRDPAAAGSVCLQRHTRLGIYFQRILLSLDDDLNRVPPIPPTRPVLKAYEDQDVPSPRPTVFLCLKDGVTCDEFIYPQILGFKADYCEYYVNPGCAALK